MQPNSWLQWGKTILKLDQLVANIDTRKEVLLSFIILTLNVSEGYDDQKSSKNSLLRKIVIKIGL